METQIASCWKRCVPYGMDLVLEEQRLSLVAKWRKRNEHGSKQQLDKVYDGSCIVLFWCWAFTFGKLYRLQILWHPSFSFEVASNKIYIYIHIITGKNTSLDIVCFNFEETNLKRNSSHFWKQDFWIWRPMGFENSLDVKSPNKNRNGRAAWKDCIYIYTHCIYIYIHTIYI